MAKSQTDPAAYPPDDWAPELRARGLRATRAGIAVLKRLQLSDVPLTHAELSAAIAADSAKIDRVTLYRVLERLEQVDLVARFAGRDGTARYAVRSAGALGYFECNACRRVIQLSEATVPPQVYQQLTSELLHRGMSGPRVSLAISGICTECSASGNADLMVIRVKG